MILVQSPSGNILVNERTGDVLDEQALRSMARQTALTSGLNPDAFEAQIASTTGFDPSNMKTANGLDPQGYFSAMLSGPNGPGPIAEDNPQQGSPRVVPNTPGGGVAPYATGGQPIGTATEPPPPQFGQLLPGEKSPLTQAAEYQLLLGQIAKLNDPTAKAYAEAQLQQLLAQTANIGAGSGASAAVSRQNNIDTLAAQRARGEITDAQWKEQYDYNKAVNDQKAVAGAAEQQRLADQFAAGQQLSREQLDVQRGNTLLGLGSRPETLIRYLYALRGQQAPQQLGGVTPALPGYPGTNALPQTTPQPAVASGAAGFSSPRPAPAAVPQAPVQQVPPPIIQNGVPMLAGGVQNGGVGSGMLTPQPESLLANNAASPNYESNLAALAKQYPALAQQLQSARGGAPALSAPPAPPVASPPTSPMANYPTSIPPEVQKILGGQSNPLASLSPTPTPMANPIGGTITGASSPDTTWRPYDPSIPAGAVVGHAPDGRTLFNNPGFNDPGYAGPGSKAYADQMAWEDKGFARGGIIPEKVVGVGQESGQTYQFGEKGTEAVMSNEMLQKLMAVAGKVDFHSKGSDGKSQRITMTLNGPPKLDSKKKPDMPGMNSYGAGGTIGYSGGKNDYNPAVFNPPDLSSIVGRGFNTPGIPLPPQVNLLTGGGQSLIPSAQTLTNALPSEVGAYSGFLTDEAGVQANDVFSLAKRLAPQVTGVRTPRYAG